MITSHGTPTTSPGSLHRPELERDACGVGFIASFKGEKSNRILQFGLQSVCRVTHRGAVDADRKTGDGAGVLTQIPFKIFEPWLQEKGIVLENGPDDLGVAMMFLPRRDVEQRTLAKKIAVETAKERGLTVLGWRMPPQNKNELGDKARLMRPSIRQLLFARPSGMDADTYERELYLTRKLIVRRCFEAGLTDEPVYIASCSHRSIVYKALCLPTALAKFYGDLENPSYESSL